jgi:hypothetical protein
MINTPLNRNLLRETVGTRFIASVGGSGVEQDMQLIAYAADDQYPPNRNLLREKVGTRFIASVGGRVEQHVRSHHIVSKHTNLSCQLEQ